MLFAGSSHSGYIRYFSSQLQEFFLTPSASFRCHFADNNHDRLTFNTIHA
ncbi:hypothetical protein BN440_3831 [Erwinia amylovora MR1]|nr:hypothetical protein BN440_3831 [Erwinia amylovora MR1]